MASTNKRSGNPAKRNAPVAQAETLKVYVVSHPSETFLIHSANGKVVKAPDVARWAIGKTVDSVKLKFKKMGCAFYWVLL